MGLTDEEREELRTQFRRDLESNFDDAEVRVKARKERRKRREEQSSAAAREAEIQRLRLEAQESFYAEKGYVRYTDSRGRTSWIPEAAAERKKRRKKRRKSNLLPAKLEQRTIAIYLGILVLAVVVGLVVGTAS